MCGVGDCVEFNCWSGVVILTIKFHKLIQIATVRVVSVLISVTVTFYFFYVRHYARHLHITWMTVSI